MEFFTAFLLKVMGEKQLSASLELFKLFYPFVGDSYFDREIVFGVEIFSVVLLFKISCSLVISDFVQVKISSTIECGSFIMQEMPFLYTYSILSLRSRFELKS